MEHTPEELAKKIKDAQARDDQNKAASSSPKILGKGGLAASRAFRAGSDMVAALIVGTAMGYGLDRLLGSRPWLMILFIFLGFGAGFLNIYRAETGQDLSTGFLRKKPKND